MFWSLSFAKPPFFQQKRAQRISLTKNENSVIIYSPRRGWKKVWWRCLVRKTFLDELHAAVSDSFFSCCFSKQIPIHIRCRKTLQCCLAVYIQKCFVGYDPSGWVDDGRMFILWLNLSFNWIKKQRTTSVEECVGVSSNNDIDPSDALGDLLIHVKARVAQGDDLVIAQGFQLVDLNLKCLHLILKLQVLAWQSGWKLG